MLTETLGGAGTYIWIQGGAAGQNTLGNGVANIVYGPALPGIPALDVEQVEIFLYLDTAPGAYAGPGIVARLRKAPDINPIVAASFIEEPVEQQGVPALGVRRDLVNIKEWGPQTASFIIDRPLAGHHFQIGIFSNGAPVAGDRVIVRVNLQRTGAQLQRGGV